MIASAPRCAATIAILVSLVATAWAQPSGFPTNPGATTPEAGRRPWNRTGIPPFRSSAPATDNSDENVEGPPAEFREEQPESNPTRPAAPPSPQKPRGGYKTRISDNAPAAQADIMAGARPVEGAELLAEVGNQKIFAADLLPMVKGTYDKIDAAVKEGHLTPEDGEAQKRLVLRGAAMGAIEGKMLYCEFWRKMNKVPEDKRPKIGEMKAKMAKDFDQRLMEERRKVETMSADELDEHIASSPSQAISRLAVAMKQRGYWTHAELERYLNGFGTSLRKQKETYAEQIFARASVSQNIDMKPEVSHDEMLAYYEENAEKYDFPARAKFEVLMVKKSKYPNQDEAEAAICDMGNEVVGGANFAAVAKRSSQGLNAEQGGFFDWMPPGTLASKVLDEAIFTIDLRKLSLVLEDDKGFYIVRVLAREEAGRKTFADVQEEIRKAIINQKQQKQYREFVTRIREETRIWTAFDEEMKVEAEKEEMARKRQGVPGLR